MGLTTRFTAIGKLEEIVTNSEKTIKYLQLATDQGQLWVKISRKLSLELSRLQGTLRVGSNLELSGKQKYKGKENQVVKYKANELKVMGQANSESEVVKSKAKVLFCKKSTCWKKGGKSACKALKTELKCRGLNKAVEIQTTGCLKQCKKAPNMVLMPDKARYSNITNKQVLKLIDKHLLVT